MNILRVDGVYILKKCFLVAIVQLKAASYHYRWKKMQAFDNKQLATGKTSWGEVKLLNVREFFFEFQEVHVKQVNKPALSQMFRRGQDKQCVHTQDDL